MREDEASHESSRGSPFGKLATQIVELHGFAALDLVKTDLQGVKRSGIGEDLGGLLQLVEGVVKHLHRLARPFAREAELGPSSLDDVAIYVASWREDNILGI
jgi:hypothetical protein